MDRLSPESRMQKMYMNHVDIVDTCFVDQELVDQQVVVCFTQCLFKYKILVLTLPFSLQFTSVWL